MCANSVGLPRNPMFRPLSVRIWTGEVAFTTMEPKIVDFQLSTVKSSKKSVGKRSKSKSKSGRLQSPGSDSIIHADGMLARSGNVDLTPTDRSPSRSVISRGHLVSRVQLGTVSQVLRQQMDFTPKNILVLSKSDVLILIYLLAGSHVFYAMDRDIVDKNATIPCEEYSLEIENCTDSSSSGIGYYPNSTTSCWKETVRAVDAYYECIKNHAVDSTLLNYVNAVIYVITIMTTIGYGHLVATGYAAHVGMIIYALITIPFLFTFFSEVVESTRNQFAILYAFMAKLVRRKRLKPGQQEPSLVRYPDLIPFLVASLIVTVYTLFVSAAFYSIKAAGFQTYLDAVYYFFQSAAMIGLGDILPKSKIFQLIAIPFVIVGIALYSMTNTVLEQWIKQFHEWFVHRITKSKQAAAASDDQTLGDLMKCKTMPEDMTFAHVDSEHSAVSHAPMSVHRRPFSVSRIRFDDQVVNDDVDTDPTINLTKRSSP